MNQIKYPWLKKYVEHFDINKLAHSHLLSGKTGIGKLHFAKELSKSLLCSNSNELFEYCIIVLHANHLMQIHIQILS